MASSTLARRLVLLGLWLVSVALLLNARNPGWWASERAWLDSSTPPDPTAPVRPRVRAIAQPHPGALVARGWRELERGDASLASPERRAEHARAARWEFRHALRLRPDDLEARLGLAEAYRRLGDPRRAWRTAAPLADRDLPLPHRRRVAQLAMQTGQMVPAADLLRSVVAQDPGDSASARDLAYALDRGGRREEAEHHYNTLLTSGQADPDSVIRYVHLLDSAGRYSEAWALLRDQPGIVDDPALRALAARNALWADDPAGAEVLLDRWRKSEPDAVEPIFLTAEARLRQGRVNGARDILSRLRRGASLDPAQREQLALLDTWAGRVEGNPGERKRPPPDLDAGAARRAEAEVALRAGDPGRALEIARAQLAREPNDADALVLAARAASELSEPAAAADLLDKLQRLRRLTKQEEDWLVGQLEAADRLEERDAILRRRLVRVENSWPRDQREIGDLRLRLGDRAGALQAYRAIPPSQQSGEVLQRIASLEASLQHRQAAIAAYQAALAASPDEVDLQLEAARFFVNAGEPAQAVALYRRVLAEKPTAAVELELARTLLASQRFVEAERAAREAIAGGDAGAEARLALAQAVQLQGRTHEAAPLFDEAIAEARAERAGPSWWARLALSRDRPLRAQQILTAALDQTAAGAAAGTAVGSLAPDGGTAAGPDSGGPEAQAVSVGADASVTGGAEEGDVSELLLLRAQAEQRLGNLAAAACDLDEAAGQGAVIGAELGQADVKKAMDPDATLRSVNFADSNALRLNGAAFSATVWSGPRIRWTLQGQASSVRQAGKQWTRTGASLGFDHLFLTSELTLDGRLGFENASNNGGALLVGNLELRKLFADTSLLGVELSRESLLRGQEDGDPRLFNRIVDLAALGPNFSVDGLRLIGEKALGDDRQDRLRAELGGEHYQDGNLRGFLYAHYQLPLQSSPGAWMVLRPNVFAETFERQETAYFSPEANASVGLAWHTIQHLGRVRIEAETNPQLEVRDGTVGFGVHGLVDLGVDVGPVNVGGSGFAFYDSISGYWLWRALARVRHEFD